jgi:hypothetical protein
VFPGINEEGVEDQEGDGYGVTEGLLSGAIAIEK